MRAQPLTPLSPDGVEILGPLGPGYEEILTHGALGFVAALARSHRPGLRRLLAERQRRQRALDRGERLDFPVETRDIRAADWTVAPHAPGLRDRRVEITGPVDRKMIINALNSGAQVFMADFEDSSSPTWANQVEGQLHLRDAVRRSIRFDDHARGKRYELVDDPATLVVRPRGLHLDEAHVLVDGAAVPAALFDFGLFLWHNAHEQVRQGLGPYFYLPKLEHYREARWWNQVFLHAQHLVGLPPGTIRATVLIETLPAAFQMDEILHELRQHSAGLNCGRWDYIFSCIKARRHDPAAVLPDRDLVTMDQPFLRAYTQLLVQTCHRRGAHAIGGMAAQIPVRDDLEANAAAIAKVRADKLREARDGHDGSWVAHPGLVSVARSVFDEHMPGPHQVHRARGDVDVAPADLLAMPGGPVTLEGVRKNVRVALQYLASWLSGQGCVPIDHLMEDAATAEISRMQLWQWIRHEARTDGGRRVGRGLFEQLLSEEHDALAAGGVAGAGPARRLLHRLVCAENPCDFLTLPAYRQILDLAPGSHQR